MLTTILISGATLAYAATLWDFVINAELEEDEIELYEKPVVFGQVLDQASKPVSDVKVTMRFSNQSATIFSDSEGNFRYEFDEQKLAGIFTVNIFAETEDKKGFSKLTLKIGSQSTTFGEIYYKSNDFDVTTNDPYAALKLKHYLKYLEEQNARQQKQLEIEAKKIEWEEKRNLAQQKLEEALAERYYGPGVISAEQQQRYLSTVNPKIRDTISSQLNYTKQLYAEAKAAMKEVLDNGGSLQEARKVYFEKLSVTRDEISDFNDSNNTANHSKIKTNEDKKINSKKVKGLTLKK